jgi:hypothetical protein
MWIIVELVFHCCTLLRADIAFVYPKDSPVIRFGAEYLESALKQTGQAVMVFDPEVTNLHQEVQVFIRIDPYMTGTDNKPLPEQSYRMTQTSSPRITRLDLIAPDVVGAMYATMDLAEQVGAGKPLMEIADQISIPRLAFRAIKFNLPWDS